MKRKCWDSEGGQSRKIMSFVGPSTKWKYRTLCPEIIKNIKMATVECQTRYEALLSTGSHVTAQVTAQEAGPGSENWRWTQGGLGVLTKLEVSKFHKISCPQSQNLEEDRETKGSKSFKPRLRSCILYIIWKMFVSVHFLWEGPELKSDYERILATSPQKSRISNPIPSFCPWKKLRFTGGKITYKFGRLIPLEYFF